jgi:hypothetical protein
MIRALNLLFAPSKTWERMALKPPSAATILVVSLLPLIAITFAVEGYGLLKLGDSTGEMGRINLPLERVIRYEAFYAVASIVVIFAGTFLLKSVAESFGVPCTFGGCFVLMACGFTPIFLLRMPDSLPKVSTWICWAVGAVLSVRILYHGVALWLKPEQTKGFGLFLVSVVYTFVLSGLVHFAAVQVLHGRLLKNVYPDKAVAMRSYFGRNLTQTGFGAETVWPTGPSAPVF